MAGVLLKLHGTPSIAGTAEPSTRIAALQSSPPGKESIKLTFSVQKRLQTTNDTSISGFTIVESWLVVEVCWSHNDGPKSCLIFWSGVVKIHNVSQWQTCVNFACRTRFSCASHAENPHVQTKTQKCTRTWECPFAISSYWGFNPPWQHAAATCRCHHAATKNNKATGVNDATALMLTLD